MFESSLWKLCQEYSIFHASLLISGNDPDDFENTPTSEIPRAARGFTAVRSALCNAVESDSIATVCVYYESDSFGSSRWIDIHRTLISSVELNRFVKAAGRVCTVFERGSGAADVADGHFYANKLDAANKAWIAVTTDPSLLVRKSPKQALKKWLVEHAEEFGLLNENGQPNKTGINEICKVANWKPEGGATPTQSAIPEAPQAPMVRPRFSMPEEPRESFSADLDDEIPF